MSSVNLRDLAGGIAIAAAGGTFAFMSRGLPDGAPGQVGPGEVPFAVGLAAAGLGAIIAARSLRASHALPGLDLSQGIRPNLRPVVAIFAAVAVFTLLIRATGFVPTIIASVIVAALGSPKNKPLPVLFLAIGTGLGCWVIFILALGLPIPAFRSPF